MSKAHMIIKLCILMIPILTLGFLVGKAEYDKRNGHIWEIKIQGYDPRDILRGQYVQFRFDWNWAENQPLQCTECCLCLSGASGSFDPESKIVSCYTPEEKGCASVIRNWDSASASNNSRIETQPYMNLFRYYLPEDEAREMQRLLNQPRRNATENTGEPQNEFSMKMNVTKNGSMKFHEFLVKTSPASKE